MFLFFDMDIISLAFLDAVRRLSIYRAVFPSHPFQRLAESCQPHSRIVE